VTGRPFLNCREARPLSSIRLKRKQEGVSGLGNPWPAEAAQARPDASSGEHLRDDDTEPLPLFAASQGAAPEPSSDASSAPARTARASSFAPGGDWWNHIAHVQASRSRPAGLRRLAVGIGLLILVVGAGLSTWLVLRPSPTSGQASVPVTVADQPAPPTTVNLARLRGLLPSGYSPSSCKPENSLRGPRRGGVRGQIATLTGHRLPITPSFVIKRRCRRFSARF
jgi:hypothetical protein